MARGALEKILRGNLAALYLHGSLALGGFNPARSDIDLLAVTARPMGRAVRRAAVRELLAASRRPCPIEISFVSRGQLFPWRHPARFELHFSESWRRRFERGLDSAVARQRRIRDPDLALHIAVARERGIRLFRGSAARALPQVPRADCFDAMLRDLRWARKRLSRDPIYFVLNSCRIYAFAAKGRMFSKLEGAGWASRRLPTAHRRLVRRALREYCGGPPAAFTARELRRFAAYIDGLIDGLGGCS